MLMLTPRSLVGWLMTALQLCPPPMRLPLKRSPPPVKHTQPWPASVASAPSLSHPPSPQYSAQALSTMLPKLWQASAHPPAALATSLPACLCVWAPPGVARIHVTAQHAGRLTKLCPTY